MIQVNARYLTQRLTGVQRYATELVRALPPERLRLLSPRLSPQAGARLGGGGPAHRALGHLQGHPWEQLELGPATLGRGGVLWSPCNVGPLVSGGQVVTIHDLFSLEHPEWVGAGFHRWYRILLPRLARRARHLLTVSEYTRGRLVEVLGVRPSRITVVPNGISAQFRPPDPDERARIQARYRLPDRFILTIGSIEPRKNLGATVEAWRGLGTGRPPLVVAGGLGDPRVFGASSLGALADEPGVHLLGYVPDEDLPGLYGLATVFVYAALLEGFGIPPLEAAACGVPVVTSGTSALPEHAAGYAALVDPLDPASIQRGLRRQLEEPPTPEELAGWSRQVHRDYAWERLAPRVLEVLERHA